MPQTYWESTEAAIFAGVVQLQCTINLLQACIPLIKSLAENTGRVQIGKIAVLVLRSVVLSTKQMLSRVRAAQHTRAVRLAYAPGAQLLAIVHSSAEMCQGVLGMQPRSVKKLYLMMRDDLQPPFERPWRRESISRSEMARSHRTRRSCFSPMTVLLCGLLRMRGMSLRQIAVMIGAGRSWTHVLCHNSISRMHRKLVPLLVKWPGPVERAANYRHYKLPVVGCVGVIDGTVIRVLEPSNRKHVASAGRAYGYYSYKHHRSCLSYQVVVDWTGMFTMVCSSLPGSANDITAFYDCPLHQQSAYYLSQGEYLLADGIYPSQSCMLVTPFSKDQLEAALPSERWRMDAFNAAHTHTRVIVEYAIGRVKGIWRILDCPASLPRRHDGIDETFQLACALTNLVMGTQGLLRSTAYMRRATGLRTATGLLLDEQAVCDTLRADFAIRREIDNQLNAPGYAASLRNRSNHIS